SKMSQPPNTTSSSLASGTNSLTFGERLSVRLPRRMVPIWVIEPIGLACPRRMASTPATKVVATAPIPGRRTPSFPLAGLMSAAFVIGLIFDKLLVGAHLMRSVDVKQVPRHPLNRRILDLPCSNLDS